jgi:nucleoid-associated protein YgaU
MKRLNAVVAVAALICTLSVVGCQEKKQEEPVVQIPEPAVQPAPYPHEQIPDAEAPVARAEASPQPAVTETPAPAEEEPITSIEPEATDPKAKTTTAKPKEKYAAPKKASRTYVVRQGDTLQKISQKFYGTTKSWRKIHNANKSTLKDPNKLTVGTKLVIP